MTKYFVHFASTPEGRYWDKIYCKLYPIDECGIVSDEEGDLIPVENHRSLYSSVAHAILVID